MVLSWVPSSDNVAVSGYRVFRSRSSSDGFTRVATVSSTSYTDASLAAHTRYYYRVRAEDAAGNLSAYSAVASARTN